MSALAPFLKDLFVKGNPIVEPGPNIPEPNTDCELLLIQAYKRDSWHFPGPQPPFNMDVAARMATWFYSAAMVYADRSMTGEISSGLLRPFEIEAADASVHYSADIVLRHLPALHELATGLAEGDPILSNLGEMAWRWPLSSVGIKKPANPGYPNLSAIRSHPGLWRLFLDRVISTIDSDCLRDEVTRSATRNSLGLHPELASQLLPYWSDVEPAVIEIPSLLR